MKILIVGSGGREYAIGKKIKLQQPQCNLYFAPGNGGTLKWGENIKETDPKEMLQFAQKNHIDLTIVGPEQPLVEGIVDLFKSHHLRIFGADKKSAELEGNKAFAKEFMQKYGIRTAEYHIFNHFVDAQKYVKQAQYPLVIKASGLASGKGVVICQDQFEAESTLKQMMLDDQFGQAGHQVVIEEYLEGFETSILSIFNGKEISCMLSAKDHKRAGENDTGPNTGGMGVIVPNPEFTKENEQDFKQNILEPTLQGLLQENLIFAGVIFFGLMITKKGCYLLEYNLRFGDPEIQTLLPLLNIDFLELIENAIDQKTVAYEWKDESSVCVVMCSGGYPREYETGFVIHGLENLSEKEYDVAGAKEIDGELVTSGGRVLDIVATGDTLENARNTAYENIHKVRFEYNYYRKDI